MFGQGYTKQETAPQVPEGDYTAKIIGVQEGRLQNGASYVDVRFSIKDNLGKTYNGYKPDTKRIFQRPESNQDVSQSAAEHGRTLADEQMRWDKQMTNFFTAFGIGYGDFNFNNWMNKTGFISVRVDKSNPSYMIIFFDAKRRQEWEAERMGISQEYTHPAQMQQSQQMPDIGSIPF